HPRLSTFVTLSPVSGFAEWLKRERADDASKVLNPADRVALANLDIPEWWQSEVTRDPVQEPLMRAAAWYFLHARARNGAPLAAADREEDELRLADEVLERHIADRRHHSAVGGVVAVVAHHEIMSGRHLVFLGVVEIAVLQQVERLVAHAIGQRLAPAPHARV